MRRRYVQNVSPPPQQDVLKREKSQRTSAGVARAQHTTCTFIGIELEENDGGHAALVPSHQRLQPQNHHTLWAGEGMTDTCEILGQRHSKIARLQQRGLWPTDRHLEYAPRETQTPCRTTCAEGHRQPLRHLPHTQSSPCLPWQRASCALAVTLCTSIESKVSHQNQSIQASHTFEILKFEHCHVVACT